jgi:dolichol-phosphate mannosyltransferase
LQALEAPLAALDLALQVVMVDDGSSDASLERMLEIRDRRADTTVVKLTRNFGAPAAIKTGYQFVTGDAFLAIAADLQDPYDEIPEMARLWREGSKFTVMVRRKREDPASSRVFSWLYYRLVRAFVFRNYPATGFDMALMDKCMLANLRDTAKNINPSLFAHYLGFSPKVLFYDREKRRHGTSGWSFRKKVNYLLDSILGFSIAPCRWITAVGVLVALLSFLYAVFIVVSVIVAGSPVPGFPTIVTLIAFLCGTNLFISGMTAEYVWRVFDEVNKRPEFVIDEVYSA